MGEVYNLSDPVQAAAGFAAAAAALRAGALVAMPTETVYGLAADATNPRAVAAIYAAKGRPRFNPLIVHVPDLEAAERLGAFDGLARRLAEAFWPGPLTLVVPARPGSPVASLATAGLDTVALRVPAHPAARRLLAEAGLPLAAPSANRSGHVSATTAAHAAEDLGPAVAAILDAGPAPLGLESTIVAVTPAGPVLLRPGGVPAEAIEAAAGRRLLAPLAAAAGKPAAPGMLASHYAPRAALRLAAAEVRPGEALLAFGPKLPPGAERAAAVRNLSPSGDLAEAAANLFDALRWLDRQAGAIAAMKVPETGLGAAINDRLRRAAAPRDQLSQSTPRGDG